MADVEKVISALECAIQYGPHYCGGEFGDENEYSRIGQDALMNALALLKAQEPRVMTMEEADKAPYVWLESDQGGLGLRRVRIVPEDSTAVCIMAFELKTTFHEVSIFERHFRCWSEKPTDEQREAIPWLT